MSDFLSLTTDDDIVNPFFHQNILIDDVDHIKLSTSKMCHRKAGHDIWNCSYFHSPTFLVDELKYTRPKRENIWAFDNKRFIVPDFVVKTYFKDSKNEDKIKLSLSHHCDNRKICYRGLNCFMRHTVEELEHFTKNQTFKKRKIQHGKSIEEIKNMEDDNQKLKKAKEELFDENIHLRKELDKRENYIDKIEREMDEFKRLIGRVIQDANQNNQNSFQRQQHGSNYENQFVQQNCQNYPTYPTYPIYPIYPNYQTQQNQQNVQSLQKDNIATLNDQLTSIFQSLANKK